VLGFLMPTLHHHVESIVAVNQAAWGEGSSLVEFMIGLLMSMDDKFNPSQIKHNKDVH
jgi:hypothetical protein